jgi:K+ transporter
VALRADNQGEGGILALTAARPTRAATRKTDRAWRSAGRADRARHFGTHVALRRRHDHTGDLVLGAVEGLEGGDAACYALRRADHRGHPDRLFSIQRFGPTHRVGRLFGPHR